MAMGAGSNRVCSRASADTARSLLLLQDVWLVELIRREEEEAERVRGSGA